MADTDKKSIPASTATVPKELRDFFGRGLSLGIPKPNILRIELLDGNARDRYLGTLQKFGDSLVKKDIFPKLNEKELDIFYGFIKGVSQQGFGFSATWDKAASGGGIVGSVKNLIKKGADAVVGKGAMDVLGKMDLSNIAQDLTGMSSKFAGSSSLKRYAGTDLKDFEVECGWYLPEQYLLCLKSLKILSRMIYPIQVKQKNLAENLTDIVVSKLRQLQEAANKTFDSDFAKTIVNTAIPKEENVKSAVNMAVNVVSASKTFFGEELTFDPLPVRVSLGQYMDIEPLVITSISVRFSKETFVNKDGRHIPITCSVTISFKFWMMPSPKLEFMSILGKEMFGEEPEPKEDKENEVAQIQNSKPVVPLSSGTAGFVRPLTGSNQ